MAATGIRSKSLPVRRQDNYNKRLTSILRAASRIIARDGFDGASIRDVAARAGIGLSGIYYYFSGKEELLYALQLHTFSSLVASLKGRLKSCRAPDEKLYAVIDNHYQFFVRNMDDLKVCVHEMRSLSGKYYTEVLKVRREYYLLVRRVVAGVCNSSPAKADASALFLFGSLNWIYTWYDPKKNANIKRLAKQLTNIYLNGIKTVRAVS